MLPTSSVRGSRLRAVLPVSGYLSPIEVDLRIGRIAHYLSCRFIASKANERLVTSGSARSNMLLPSPIETRSLPVFAPHHRVGREVGMVGPTRLCKRLVQIPLHLLAKGVA